MKRIIYRFFVSAAVPACLIFCLATIVSAAPEGAQSLREFLVKSKNVAAVYPVDDYLTFVVPESSLMTSGFKGDFDDEFLRFCRERGALEALFRTADPLTGKENGAWRPLKLEEKDRFTHPQTGKIEKFGGEMLYRGIPTKGAAASPVRIKDYMEVMELFKGEKDAPRAFLIQTKDKQPFVYKIKSLPAYDKLTMPPDGDLVKNIAELRDSRKDGLLFKSRQDFKDGDIFVFLTALSRKFNLTPRYAVNEGEFVPIADATIKYFVNNAWQSGYFKTKLKEITAPLEIFKFTADLGREKNKFAVWYFWAAGDKKFVSRGAEERTIDDKGVLTSRSTAVFANDRGMDGIEFTPAKK